MNQPSLICEQKNYRLIIVLRGRPCRYTGCNFCALPSVAGGNVAHNEFHELVSLNLNKALAQVDVNIQEIFLYNFGNVLDPENLLPDTLDLIVDTCKKKFHKLSILSMDNRLEPQYGFTETRLLNVHKRLQPIQTEIAVGYETHDASIRNRVLGKGLSDKRFSNAMKLLAQNGWIARIYLILKPSLGMSDDSATKEIIDSVEYVLKVAKKIGIQTRIHMNVGYVARGTSMEQWATDGEYTPPSQATVTKAFALVQALNPTAILGNDDEGLSA